MQNHWSIRPQVLDAIRECHEIKEETFTSSLKHNTSLNSYRSAYKRDSILGAKFDAYTEILAGACI